MKIVVFSDSHDYINNMIKTVNREMPDMIIHLGDHVSDAIKIKDAHEYSIKG